MIKIREEEKVHKIEKHLLKCHKGSRQEYLSSEEFMNILRQHLTDLRKPDRKEKSVFSHVHDVVVHLKNAAATLNKQRSAEKSHADKDKCEAFVNRSVNNDAPKEVVDHAKSDGHDVDQPCGSKDVPGTSRTSATNDSNEQKIRRLEKLMGRLDREIRRYSEKELSLDDLKNDDSAHMIEHKLRKRFVEAWEKWCKLKGYEGKTGRVTEKKIRFQGTRYPEINRKVEKLVNRNKFPDFHDVYHLIQRTNESKKLGIHRFDLHQISKEVFEDIGEKLSQRRNEDLVYNFGYATLFDMPADPAEENTDLERKLAENANVGRQMMNGVFEKYTRKQNELLARGVNIDADSTSEPEAIVDLENNAEELATMNDDGSESQEITTDEGEEAIRLEANGNVPEKLSSKRTHEDVSTSPCEEKKVKLVKTEFETFSSSVKTQSTLPLNGMPPRSGGSSTPSNRPGGSNPTRIVLIPPDTSTPKVAKTQHTGFSNITKQGPPTVKHSISIDKPINSIPSVHKNPSKVNGKSDGMKPSQVRTSVSSATPGRLTSLSRSIHSLNGTPVRRINTTLIQPVSTSPGGVKGATHNTGKKQCASKLSRHANGVIPKSTPKHDDDDDDDDDVIVLD